MSLQNVARGWLTRVNRDWSEFTAELPEQVARARRGEAVRLLPFIADELLPALLVANPGATAIATDVAPLLHMAINSVQRTLPPDGPIGITPLGLASTTNALACAGAEVAPDDWHTIRAWLPRVAVSREDAWASDYWVTGFAALSLGSAAAYRRVAIEALDDAAPGFAPGQSFEFNVQALLRYLRSAALHQATLPDVLPAWEGFLDAFAPLRAARSVDKELLFWVGRLVFHHIGGRPLGEVAHAIHESIWTHAGLEP